MPGGDTSECSPVKGVDCYSAPSESSIARPDGKCDDELFRHQCCTQLNWDTVHTITRCQSVITGMRKIQKNLCLEKKKQQLPVWDSNTGFRFTTNDENLWHQECTRIRICRQGNSQSKSWDHRLSVDIFFFFTLLVWLSFFVMFSC